MFYGIQNFRHFRETVSNPTNARYKIPKTKISKYYKVILWNSKFQNFLGCLSNPTNAKKKIDKSNIQANCTIQKYICYSAMNIVIDKCNALSVTIILT